MLRAPQTRRSKRIISLLGCATDHCFPHWALNAASSTAITSSVRWSRYSLAGPLNATPKQNPPCGGFVWMHVPGVCLDGDRVRGGLGNGSPGWIRTTECLSQSQVPYRLATGLWMLREAGL
jgi:hypothetical protein